MASLTTSINRVLARRAAVLTTTRSFSADLLTAVEEFPGLPAVTPTQAKSGSASVTALPSGLTVVSEDASTTTTVTLTFPKAGSADEELSESGAALINRYLAFKSGSDMSSVYILRSLENEGATPFATAGRRGATIGFTTAPDKVVDLIPLLATDCSFEKWDVRDAKQVTNYDIQQANACAQVTLTEQLFAAAYGPQTPMGRPFYSSDASTAAIQSFRSRTYGLNGAVLAATGVADHGAFVAAVQEGLSGAAAGSEGAPAATVYMGGEARLAAPSTGYAHVALGFEGPSASTPLLNVLKHCLDLMGGDGVSAFATPGLVGIHAMAPSAGASGVIDVLCGAVSPPSADIVKRAKGLAKAEAFFALDNGSKALADAMTASVLETGTFSSAEVAEAYDSIADKDVTAAFSTMAKSNPSVAAVGDIASVPYHATVAARFS